MKKPIQLSIPQPCHEDWDKMTPDDKGRFCAVCEKKVFDFTQSSDREIAMALKGKDGACGRFLPSQLDRQLYVPKERKGAWAASAAVLSFFALGSAEGLAQTPVPTEQRQPDHRVILGKVAPRPQTITGVVSDQDKMPIIGGNVIIEGTNTGTQTDFDGEFTIEAREGSILVFSYPGYTTVKYAVPPNAPVVTILMTEELATEGVVVESYRTIGKPVTMVGAISTYRKRTLFGRIFHSIGDLFR